MFELVLNISVFGRLGSEVNWLLVRLFFLFGIFSAITFMGDSVVEVLLFQGILLVSFVAGVTHTQKSCTFEWLVFGGV